MTQQEQILENILGELKRQNAPNRLWNAQDIADYMNLEKGTVQSTVLRRQGFPKAVKIPTTKDGGGRRWVPKEVQQWCLKFRESA